MRRQIDPSRHFAMPEATFSVNLLRDIVHYAATQGIDANHLCTTIGISPDLLEQPDRYISGEPLQALWRELVQQTGDDNVGLHMGESFNLSAIGILGYVLFNCQTIEQVLEKLARYTALFSQGVTIQVSVASGQVWCDCEVVSHLKNYLLEAPRQPIESTFSALLTAIKTLTGKPLVLNAVWFQHPRPRDIAEHQRIFRVPVQFSQPHSRLVFDVACLQWAVLSANPSLLQTFEDHAEILLSELNHSNPYTHQVMQEITRQLTAEVPAIETIARSFAISVRHLQRSLQAEGTSYQRLLDQTRKELALRYLKKSDTAIYDIAFLLGFSEPSAFNRAFKRWTGKTPRDYRLLP